MLNNTKKAIFDSAIKIFSKDGYDGATMDDVASNAGVAKGTLYYHFKSKEEIFKYIIKEGMNLIKEKIDYETSKVDSSIAKLKVVCKVQLCLVNDNRDFFKVVMSQLWGQEIRQLELRKVVGDYIDNIKQYLDEAMQDGVIKKGNSSFMAYTVFGTICSATIYELINRDIESLDKLIDNLMNYMMFGIEA